MFKKAFWVPYEDSTNYPTLANNYGSNFKIL